MIVSANFTVRLTGLTLRDEADLHELADRIRSTMGGVLDELSAEVTLQKYDDSDGNTVIEPLSRSTVPEESAPEEPDNDH